jgi:hypothetical protein
MNNLKGFKKGGAQQTILFNRTSQQGKQLLKQSLSSSKGFGKED